MDSPSSSASRCSALSPPPPSPAAVTATATSPPARSSKTSRDSRQSDAAAITFADLAQARVQLGLPADADALSFEALQGTDIRDPTPEAALVEAAVLSMPPLTSFVVTLEEDPAAEVFDGTAITGAINTIGEGFPMTILKTDQPFSEIADGLTALGYTEEGSTLTKEGERFEQVADAGDGIVVIGNNGAAGRRSCR